MLSLEQIGNIINGVYQYVKNKNNDLLMETVNGIDDTISNDFFRAVNSYPAVSTKELLYVLSLVGKYLQTYYGKIPVNCSEEESEKVWGEAIDEANNIVQAVEGEFDKPHLRDYTTRIVVAAMDILEKDYNIRKLNKNQC
jgi:hypothetical protein